MNRKNAPFLILCIISFVSVAMGASASGADAPAGKRPNVLFILADDWGWGDLTCHGSKVVDTPNLDRLASEGTEFYQFNVGSPVCSPSRVAFTTGQFPARFGIHEAIGAAVKNREIGQVDWLDPKATTLPRLLKSAGYATGHFGKWHLCGQAFDDAPLPAAYGIDEHACWTGSPKMNPLEHTQVFDAAIAFMRKHKDEPFYLNLWIHQTHAPQEPSKESLARYAHLPEQQRPYSGAVADGDTGIGKVLAALKELGLEQNTLVVFTSDNGPENTGHTDEQKELRGGYGTYYSVGTTGDSRGRKRSLYEGGVRLPFMVRWPGHVPAGRIDKATNVASVDFLPTVCALVGVALPDGYKPDGESMVPALLGEPKPRSKPVFWNWRGKDKPADCWPRWAVRDGQWKLEMDDKGRIELYDAPNDWSEAKNIAKDHADIVQKLTAELSAWKASLPAEPSQEFISKSKRSRKNAKGADDE